MEKTITLSGNTLSRFDEVFAKYHHYPGPFEIWCGLDYTGFDQPGYGPAAVAELERCHHASATGGGELSVQYKSFSAVSNGYGLRIPLQSSSIDIPSLDAAFLNWHRLGIATPA